MSFIIDELPPERWRHVPGPQNPADCASRGLFPAQLKEHPLWWEGPHWLRLESSVWPEQPNLSSATMPVEERSVCHLATMDIIQPIISLDCSSKFATLKQVTTWMFRFITRILVLIFLHRRRDPPILPW